MVVVSLVSPLASPLLSCPPLQLLYFLAIWFQWLQRNLIGMTGRRKQWMLWCIWIFALNNVYLLSYFGSPLQVLCNYGLVLGLLSVPLHVTMYLLTSPWLLGQPIAIGWLNKWAAPSRGIWQVFPGAWTSTYGGKKFLVFCTTMSSMCKPTFGMGTMWDGLALF